MCALAIPRKREQFFILGPENNGSRASDRGSYTVNFLLPQTRLLAVRAFVTIVCRHSSLSSKMAGLGEHASGHHHFFY